MRSTSTSAPASPARRRSSSTSFSKRSFSFWRALSLEGSAGGGPGLRLSLVFIPAPFQRPGCRKFLGLLSPIRAWFSRPAAPAERPRNHPPSTIRTPPGTPREKRQTNPPNGRAHLRSAIAFRFEREARWPPRPPPFPRAGGLPAKKAASPLLPLARELSVQAERPASRSAQGARNSPETQGAPGRRSYPES